jgi:hypothetical protein
MELRRDLRVVLATEHVVFLSDLEVIKEVSEVIVNERLAKSIEFNDLLLVVVEVSLFEHFSSGCSILLYKIRESTLN